MDKDPNRAPPCDQSQCILPDCFCSPDGTQIPGRLEPNSIPQMVMITFDDAINNNNIEIYEKLFKEGRHNPNGCSIKSTFFISHKYSNYSAVQEVHRRGHEIAAHSITHNPSEKYWSEANVETWAKEMAGVRLIIERFSNITDNSIVGVRAPYLRVGGNNQFFMMEEQAFLYDSTITAPLSNPPLWPYTLYFRMPHKCHGNGQNCPTRYVSTPPLDLHNSTFPSFTSKHSHDFHLPRNISIYLETFPFTSKNFHLPRNISIYLEKFA